MVICMANVLFYSAALDHDSSLCTVRLTCQQFKPPHSRCQFFCSKAYDSAAFEHGVASKLILVSAQTCLRIDPLQARLYESGYCCALSCCRFLTFKSKGGLCKEAQPRVSGTELNRCAPRRLQPQILAVTFPEKVPMIYKHAGYPILRPS